MKKTGLISAIAIGLFTLMLCGCGPTTYFESWYDENGYVEITEEPNSDPRYEPIKTYEFIPYTNPKTINKDLVVRWDHSYGSSNLECKFEVQKVENDPANGIAYQFTTFYSKNFILTSNFYTKIDGFYFYRDRDRVYVLNDMYRYGYYDHTGYDQGKRRFKISINGMKPLEIEMDYPNNITNNPYPGN